MHTVKIGPDRWLEEGFKKGKVEGQMAIQSEIALRMIEEGMSLDIVCRMTGLKRGELTRLKRNQA